MKPCVAASNSRFDVELRKCSEEVMGNIFTTANVYDKIRTLRSSWQDYFQAESLTVPLMPERDITVVSPELLPPKRGLSYQEGQARLLHDLASIELQAMELAVRGVVDYPQASEEFRAELMELALSEASHLELCLRAIESLGFKWGDWPVHNMLWQSVRVEDELLDRILLVHCYLEGSGLDAGDTILRRLYGLTQGVTFQTVQTIVREEVDHVQFGLNWYRKTCLGMGLDPELDFASRFARLRQQIPKRIEPLSLILRQEAGFSSQQIQVLEDYRRSIVKYRPAIQQSLPSDHLSGIIKTK